MFCTLPSFKEDDDPIVGRLATVDAGGAEEEDPELEKSDEAAV